MPDPQPFGLAGTHWPGTHRDDAAALTESTDLAALIAEARAIVAGAEIRPTRAHLAACLIWLDGGPLTLSEVPLAR